MKIGVYSGANNEGERDLYGTIENLPTGKLAFTGNELRMQWFSENFQTLVAFENQGKEPTAEELVNYILANEKTGRVKELKGE